MLKMYWPSGLTPAASCAAAGAASARPASVAPAASPAVLAIPLIAVLPFVIWRSPRGTVCSAAKRVPAGHRRPAPRVTDDRLCRSDEQLVRLCLKFRQQADRVLQSIRMPAHRLVAALLRPHAAERDPRRRPPHFRHAWRREQSFDLAIIGGGMTGLALACATAGAALRVLLIERAAARRDARAAVRWPRDGDRPGLAPPARGDRRLARARRRRPADPATSGSANATRR